MADEKLLLKDEVYALVGAAIEVHRVLGHGFAEAVYQEAVALELKARAIAFEPNKKLTIRYKQWVLEKYYVADFIGFGKVLIEVKAQDRIYPRDESQLLNYLKATSIEVGVILNFGFHGRLEWKRMVMTPYGVVDPDEEID